MEQQSKQKLKKKAAMGAWIDTIYGGLGKFANMETLEGIQRSGKLTGVRTKELELNGAKEQLVTELELNGDPTDTILVASLRKLNIG